MKQVIARLAKKRLAAKQCLITMQQQFHRRGNPDDPRIKAAFLMAPQGPVFDLAGLASTNRPVFLHFGQNDEVLRPAYNARHIAPPIKTLMDIRMIPEAGHYVFLSPCSPQLAKAAPDICTDPPGVDRTEVHRQIDADALAFFRKTLGNTAD